MQLCWCWTKVQDRDLLSLNVVPFFFVDCWDASRELMSILLFNVQLFQNLMLAYHVASQERVWSDIVQRKYVEYTTFFHEWMCKMIMGPSKHLHDYKTKTYALHFNVAPPWLQWPCVAPNNSMLLQIE
ncbi:hypothetical protein VIGAN_07153600 [Vigna angularis var. angularis]|uniref:Uncharacterized protein n=1 Tax=Vigna angularis var. angularis TaxID=157739 RepID=A0A0S3SIT1_PHAAN|nr:hypothetical protein VIGAN_07153600 [Vigna angularis var. angularis]